MIALRAVWKQFDLCAFFLFFETGWKLKTPSRMDAYDIDVELKIESYKNKKKKILQQGVIMTHTRLECFVSLSFLFTHGRYDFPKWKKNAYFVCFVVSLTRSISNNTRNWLQSGNYFRITIFVRNERSYWTRIETVLKNAFNKPFSERGNEIPKCSRVRGVVGEWNPYGIRRIPREPGCRIYLHLTRTAETGVVAIPCAVFWAGPLVLYPPDER